MGCWATDSFSNDDASDWLAELEECDNLEHVQTALSAVVSGRDEYLDASDACQALAAAEVVAAARGHGGAAVSGREPLVEWLERVNPMPSKQLVNLAVKAVERVLADNSELRELWEETEDFSAWRADVTSLLARLRA